MTDVKQSFAPHELNDLPCFQIVERVVRVHELTTWIEGRETPANVDDILQLIHLVADWEQERLASGEKVAAASAENDVVRHSVTVMCL